MPGVPSNIPAQFLRTASPEEAMKAFSEAADEAAEAAKKAARAQKDNTDQIDKANKSLRQRLRQRAGQAAALGLGALAQQAAVTANTTNATFAQGLTNAVNQGFVNTTGFGKNRFDAIRQAGNDTAGFFGDFAFLGGQVSDRDLARIQDLFQEGRQNQADLNARINGDVKRRQNDAVADDIAQRALNILEAWNSGGLPFQGGSVLGGSSD